jgi:hypothetical protein
LRLAVLIVRENTSRSFVGGPTGPASHETFAPSDLFSSVR